MHQLIDQHCNPVDQGGNKNAPGGFITVSIDIDCKQDGIGQQGNAADSRQQLFICMQHVKIFPETDGAAENPEIINSHGQEGTDDTEQDTKFQIIFFEYQNFQDFSSLVFKT